MSILPEYIPTSPAAAQATKISVIERRTKALERKKIVLPEGGITNVHVENYTITTVSIAAGTITATNIAAGTITGTNIAGATITGDKLVGATITGDKIAADTIDASSIEVTELSALSANLGTITAGTISGATFQTSASNPRVVMDSSGIYAKDSGGVDTFRASASSGAVTLRAVVQSLAGSQIPTDQLQGQITAAQINVSSLSAISANMGTITSGSIIGATIQTAASGARVKLDITGLTNYDATGEPVVFIPTADAPSLFSGRVVARGGLELDAAATSPPSYKSRVRWINSSGVELVSLVGTRPGYALTGTVAYENQVLNPSGETGVHEWYTWNSSGTPTIDRIAGGIYGSWLIRMTMTATATGAVGIAHSAPYNPSTGLVTDLTKAMAVTPGQMISARVNYTWINSRSVSGIKVGLIVYLWTAAGAFAGAWTVYNPDLATLRSLSLPEQYIPSNAAYATVGVFTDGYTANGQSSVVYFEAVEFYKGGLPDTYIDGSQPNCEWLGTAHNSKSRLMSQQTADGALLVHARYAGNYKARVITTPGAADYWRLGTSAGANDLAASRPMTFAGTVSPRAGLINDPDGALYFQAESPQGAATYTTPTPGSAPYKPQAAGWSAEVWCKPLTTTGASGDGWVFIHPNSWGIYYDYTNQHWGAGLVRGGVLRTINQANGGAPRDGVYHVVLTWDGVNQRLYVNGSLIGFLAEPGPIDTGNANIHLGSFFAPPFDVIIDEAVIYNHTLTAGSSSTQIEDHYATGIQGFSPNAPAHERVLLDTAGRSHFIQGPPDRLKKNMPYVRYKTADTGAGTVINANPGRIPIPTTSVTQSDAEFTLVPHTFGGTDYYWQCPYAGIWQIELDAQLGVSGETYIHNRTTAKTLVRDDAAIRHSLRWQGPLNKNDGIEFWATGANNFAVWNDWSLAMTFTYLGQK